MTQRVSDDQLTRLNLMASGREMTWDLSENDCEAIAAALQELTELRAVKSETVSPANKLAKLFHETYERLAPSFGYETRIETAKCWDEIPDCANKRLMEATCAELLGHVSSLSSQAIASAAKEAADKLYDEGIITDLGDASDAQEIIVTAYEKARTK